MVDSPVLHATSKQPRLRAPLPMNPLWETMALSAAQSATGPRALRLRNLPQQLLLPMPGVLPPTSPAVPAQPVTSPAASDNRSIDEKWDAAVAALPETIREYVSRDKVPTVKFGPNRKGLPCLSMTFDKSLSQHAFALAVDNSGKKAAAVVMDAVRNEFGANAVIAPSAVAANGERVESVKRMSRSNWPRSSSRLPWPRLDWPRRVWARAWAFIWGARRKLRSRLQQAKPRTQTTAIEPDNPVHPRQRRTGVTMTLGPSRP